MQPKQQWKNQKDYFTLVQKTSFKQILRIGVFLKIHFPYSRKRKDLW